MSNETYSINLTAGPLFTLNCVNNSGSKQSSLFLVNTPKQQIFSLKVGSKTSALSLIENKGDTGPKGDQGDPGPKGDKGDPGNDGQDGQDWQETFETISQGLSSYNATITRANGTITLITYALGSSQTIVKTINRTGGNITSIVLSGDLPSGLTQVTKTLIRNGQNEITGWSYS